MPIQAVEPRRLFRRIADQIRAPIALEIEGLLDVREGSGIYVTRPGEGKCATELSGASGPFEVIRARWMIEGECAALAARNAGPASSSTR